MVFKHSNRLLAHIAVIGWCFEDAWELGLGRHYLG
ncbi:rpoE leader peptide RseD [Raoultella sp. Lac2]|nr:rpoE leader peptide RseD [Raoultella sp. Lac2]MXF99957.1 rpoE leader peptide RseD [Raoultella sp. Lac1]NEM65047.1 rpoE leader peptide RseD [Escherichia coli]